MLPADWGDGYPNVWLGTTAEDAGAYRQRVTHLLKVPAAIHFVSYEPAIGPLASLEIDGKHPDWLIIGGESEVRSDLIRRTAPQWARDAIAECRRLGIAAFLKQWGTYKNNPFVAERQKSISHAMRLDPPENGGKAAENWMVGCGENFQLAKELLRLRRPKGEALSMAEKDDRYLVDEDGLLVEKVGPWAKQKLKLVTDYIQASGGARRDFLRTGAAYIDVFSGAWSSKIRDNGQFIDGSPVAAFKKGEGITRAVHINTYF